MRFNKNTFTMRHKDVVNFVHTVKFRKIRLLEMSRNEKIFLREKFIEYKNSIGRELKEYGYKYFETHKGWLLKTPRGKEDYKEDLAQWRLQRRYFLVEVAIKFIKKKHIKSKQLTRFKFMNS